MAFDDPFACFDSFSEENEENIAQEDSLGEADGDEEGETSATNHRSADCGVLTFHHNTELSLCMHVQNAMRSGRGSIQRPHTNAHDKSSTEEDNILSRTGTSAACRVLDAIDEFCWHRHWMMHVGPDKGEIVTKALRKTIATLQRGEGLGNTDKTSFVAVELGTYCGYASILIGRELLRASEMHGTVEKERNRRSDFHLYTIEVNPEHVKVANEMIRLAELEDFVSVILTPVNIDGSTPSIADVIKEEMQKRKRFSFNSKKEVESSPDSGKYHTQIHFLFIDHDKDLYLSDLRNLERGGMVQAGTCVAADNVLFTRIDNYLNYMRELADSRITVTQTIESRVEYSERDAKPGVKAGNSTNHENTERTFLDGVEITKYLKSPP